MRICLFFVALVLSFTCVAVAADNADTAPLDTRHLETLAVQHQGRIKPWDSFARSVLLRLQGKQRFQGEPAGSWLLRVLSDREAAYQLKVFKIYHDAVVEAVGVEPDKEYRYSLAQLEEAFVAHEPLIEALRDRSEQDNTQLDLTEQQLIQAYNQVSFYRALVFSASCFWEDIPIQNPDIASAFGLEPGTSVSYYYFAANREQLRKVLIETAKRTETDAAYDDSDMRRIWSRLDQRPLQESSNQLAVIPVAEGQWLSPWDVLSMESLSSEHQALMDELAGLFQAAAAQDQAQLDRHARAFQESADVQGERLALEVFYNKADFFYYSLYLYIAAFLSVLFFGFTHKRGFYRAGFCLLSIGALLHLSGVGLRMAIMMRPPVSTLYESVIFAALIAVLFGLVVEHYRRNSLGMLGACIAGIVLQFVGFSYAAEGDTMGMLQAVLNSVFWLATHVVTITIGYGCALLAGLYGHIMLVRAIWYSEEQQKNKEIFQTARGIALVALFFTTLGTILGGIWADQSWGRFWGWDPKENGAMLIVLWLLIAIHGNISGELKQIGFAMFLSLTTICVALAWFGVNLLSVGLHSYGFSDKTAFALFAFCGLELVLVIPAAFWAMRKQQHLKGSASTE